MKQEHELPPNPIMPVLAALIDKASGKGTADTVWQLMQEFAGQAIEADRKRRGEPVMYQVRTRPNWNDYWNRWEECTREQAEGYRRNPIVHDWHYEVRELFTAPQPAEPVKVPSDYERGYSDGWAAGWDQATESRVKVPSDADIELIFTEIINQEARTGMGHQVAFARALLARYSQQDTEIKDRRGYMAPDGAFVKE